MALALDELKDSDDTYNNDGLTFLIDKDLSTQIGQVNVDFVEQGFRSGFMVTSEKPIQTGPSTCGGSCSC